MPWHTLLHGQGVLQSSNVATYIAHGDVALSVLMTTASTLGAIVMTPLLTKTLAGAYIAVDAKVRALSFCKAVYILAMCPFSYPVECHDVHLFCAHCW